MLIISKISPRIIFRRILIPAVIAISLFSAGCVYDPVYYGPPPHSDYRPHIYDYYYYPSVGVYFHFTSGYYYYRDRQRWIRSRVLPPHIHIDSKSRVRIRVDADKPMVRHKEHVRTYKPRPDYHSDKKRSIKEREANKRWYENYKMKEKQMKKEQKKEDNEKQQKRRH